MNQQQRTPKQLNRGAGTSRMDNLDNFDDDDDDLNRDDLMIVDRVEDQKKIPYYQLADLTQYSWLHIPMVAQAASREEIRDTSSQKLINEISMSFNNAGNACITPTGNCPPQKFNLICVKHCFILTQFITTTQKLIVMSNTEDEKVKNKMIATNTLMPVVGRISHERYLFPAFGVAIHKLLKDKAMVSSNVVFDYLKKFIDIYFDNIKFPFVWDNEESKVASFMAEKELMREALTALIVPGKDESKDGIVLFSHRQLFLEKMTQLASYFQNFSKIYYMCNEPGENGQNELKTYALSSSHVSLYEMWLIAMLTRNKQSVMPETPANVTICDIEVDGKQYPFYVMSPVKYSPMININSLPTDAPPLSGVAPVIFGENSSVNPDTLIVPSVSTSQIMVLKL